MRSPANPGAREGRAVPRYLRQAGALAHLLLSLTLIISNPWSTAYRHAAAWWALLALAVGAILLLHGAQASRRAYSLPDVSGILCWFAAGILELHGVFPVISGARVVAAPLFLLFAWFAPSTERLIALGVIAAWGIAFNAGDLSNALVGTVIDAAVFFPAGRLLGRWLPWPQGFLQIENRRRSAGETKFDQLPEPIGGRPPSRGSEEPFPTDRLDRLRKFANPLEGVRRVVEGVLPLCGSDVVFFAQGNPLRIVFSQPPGRGFAPGDALPDPLKNLVAEALETRRTIRYDGRKEAPMLLSLVSGKVRPTALALVPVQNETGVAGILGAVRLSDEAWEEPVVPMLEQGAFFIGRELELKSRIESVYWEVDRADGIYHLVRRIAEAADLSREGIGEGPDRRTALYRITCECVGNHLDAGRVMLVQVERGGKTGSIAWETGDGSHVEPRRENVDLGTTYIEWVARKGERRLVKSSTPIPVLPEEWREAGDGSAILLPVSLPDGFQGVMACFSRDGEDAFDLRDILRGEQFLNVMRMGISHTEEVERLANEAQTDGLTGLLNRKTFCARLDKVLERLDRRRPCAVIMLDIDHFKRINDGYGHPAGDEVIRTFAGVIERTVRKGDFAGRYGGEEFVLYMEDVDGAKAMQAAERLRLLIRNIKYNFSGKEIIVTASMGLACYPDHGILGEELIKNADEALYRSKAGGRDRVTAHGPSESNPVDLALTPSGHKG
ncbi:MAG TPA: GGDEF domain-containing protein [Candidatus Deferrimicrobiaceae bacterium]|jgi:diguanylate cyclase (GGDEF)-like protein